jgi:hypothetical protein
MAIKTVNLDAMIPREDLENIVDINGESEKIREFALKDFVSGGFISPNLRKPDFQRETNHWSPEQIELLIQSFMDGDVIPSIITWQSTTSPNIFVIDGGHRLSALRAWIEDDYGDGLISIKFFGNDISQDQKKAAEKTRKLVEKSIGRFESWNKLNQLSIRPEKMTQIETKRLRQFSTGKIQVQWVYGNANRAQDSFFKINKQGTPLDETEELLIRNRKTPIAISARAIIRAGRGHKYWYDFDESKKKQIEKIANEIHRLLFNPEYSSPIKTLDLPIGGTAGVRTALSLLIEFILIANRDQQGNPEKVEKVKIDTIGDDTIKTLSNTLYLVQRMTGNDRGSLGLHPAIYFYSNSGKYAIPLFMGMSTLIAKKLVNNDPTFFPKFTGIRKDFEEFIVKKRALLGTISQQIRSKKRYQVIADLYEFIIAQMIIGKKPSSEMVIEKSGLKVDVLVPKAEASATKFSDDSKSGIFFRDALKTAIRCAICKAYLDPAKSLSYDHKQRVREKGTGNPANGQMVHPFCNQSIKK